MYLLEISIACSAEYQQRVYEAYERVQVDRASVFSLTVQDDRLSIERIYSFETGSKDIFLGLGRLGSLDQLHLAIALHDEFKRLKCVTTMVFRIHLEDDPEDKFRAMMLVSMTEASEGEYVTFHCAAVHE